VPIFPEFTIYGALHQHGEDATDIHYTDFMERVEVRGECLLADFALCCRPPTLAVSKERLFEANGWGAAGEAASMITRIIISAPTKFWDRQRQGAGPFRRVTLSASRDLVVVGAHPKANTKRTKGPTRGIGVLCG
jgi:hypothetical protein